MRFGNLGIQHIEQTAGIEFEATRAQLESLTARQPGKAGRQFVRTGHRSTLDKDRDDPDIALQGSLDLYAYKVVRLGQPRPSLLVG
jgi:hypothetical protein